MSGREVVLISIVCILVKTYLHVHLRMHTIAKISKQPMLVAVVTYKM